MKNDLIYYELKRIIERMNYEADAVVVEGLRDEKALIRLGFKNKIIKCAMHDIAEIEGFTEKCSSIAILTDFDEHGKKLNRSISSYLQCRGIKVRGFYRKKIREVLKNRNTIESINNLCDAI
ncbi:MAG: hypothetical protein QXQ40_01525 [Candidatus Aenigmatarchaeota archaeon]